MPRIALINMSIGFFVLALVAAAGAFLATDITDGFLVDKAIMNSWQHIIQKSSHGHTNLFAILHILFGLTLPYSKLSNRWHVIQTFGLAAGTFAMGPGMLVRAVAGPESGINALDIVLGGCLSAALVTLVTHGAALAARVMRGAA